MLQILSMDVVERISTERLRIDANMICDDSELLKYRECMQDAMKDTNV